MLYLFCLTLKGMNQGFNINKFCIKKQQMISEQVFFTIGIKIKAKKYGVTIER